MELTDQIFNYLKEYKTENGKLPTTQMVGEKFNLSQNKVIEQFRYLKKEGKLKLNTSRYKPGENFFSDNGKKKIKIKELISSITIIVIRIIMALISIGACILSTWFTASFLMDSLNPVLAYILSIIMILFSVMAFETIIIFFKNKQLPLVLLFSFLWIVVLIFSMFSTVATQYNERIKNDNQDSTQSAEKTIDKKKYDILEKEEKEIEQQIELKQTELQPYLDIMSSFQTKEDRKSKDDKWTYWNASEKVQAINKEIDKLNIKLSKKRNEILKELDRLNKQEDKTGIIQGTEKETKSFYKWLSEIFNVEIQYVQFWPSTFPAVFIDIIAPLSLAICMFLKRKEEKNEK